MNITQLSIGVLWTKTTDKCPSKHANSKKSDEQVRGSGVVPPVNAFVLKTYRRIVAREYRNRRIGDLLKELRLTEGRGTGFPTIYSAMSDNDSPEPLFETDDETYFLVILPIHVLAGYQVSTIVKTLIFYNLQELI